MPLYTLTDPLSLTERTVSSPSTNTITIFAYDNGDGTNSIHVRTSTGDEYILLAKRNTDPDPPGTVSAFLDFAHTNTLAFNLIE